MVTKKMAIKKDNGEFDTPIDIGADAVNVDMANGTSAEVTIQKILTNIGAIDVEEDGNIATRLLNLEGNKKVVRNSDTTGYGTESFGSSSTNVNLDESVNNYTYLLIEISYQNQKSPIIIVPVSYLKDTLTENIICDYIDTSESKKYTLQFTLALDSLGSSLVVSNIYTATQDSSNFSIAAGLEGKTLAILNVYAIIK